MNEKTDSNIEAIAKLIEFTQKGRIEWRPEHPDVVKELSPDDIISYVFTAEFNGRTLRIYRRRYKAQFNSGLGFAFRNGALTENKTEARWVSVVILELLSEHGLPTWQFPREQILDDLLNTIRYKASGASDLIQDLLRES